MKHSVYDRRKQACKLVICLLCSLILAGCTLTQPLPTPMPTSSSTPTSFPTSTITPTAEIPSNWEILQPGLARHTLEVNVDDQYLESIYVLRLDPTYFQFDVAYDPKGFTLENWQARTGALIVVNGGYFRLENESYLPNGLTIIDGVPMGTSFADFGGMFVVNENGPELRWLAEQPYNPDEPLLAALQSFPILVKPGGELGFPAEYEDNRPARRTIIAQDQTGHILLMVAPQGNLTLHQLSKALTESELELEIALNLDGGPSSGILLSEPFESISAISALPIVITVFAR